MDILVARDLELLDIMVKDVGVDEIDRGWGGCGEGRGWPGREAGKEHLDGEESRSLARRNQELQE